MENNKKGQKSSGKKKEDETKSKTNFKACPNTWILQTTFIIFLTLFQNFSRAI